MAASLFSTETPSSIRNGAYWKKKLGEITPLRFPIDYPDKRNESTHRLSHHTFEIPSEAVSGVNSMMKSQKLPIASPIFYSAFTVALHRFVPESKDIYIVHPVEGLSISNPTGRSQTCEVNTPMLLRTKLGSGTGSSSTSFSSIVTETQTSMHEAIEHKKYSYNNVQKIPTKQTDGISPFRQYLFFSGRSSDLLINPNSAHFHFQIIDYDESPLTGNLGDYDLALVVISSGTNTWHGILFYNQNLFAAESITRFCEAYSMLLTAAVKKPKESIDHLPLLTDAQAKRMLVTWNGRASSFPDSKTIPTHLDSRIKKWDPNSIAVSGAGLDITYPELQAKSAQLATKISQGPYGVKMGTHVGLFMQAGAEFVVGALACLRLGAVFVPLSMGDPQERTGLIVKETSLKLILTQEASAQYLPTSLTKVSVFAVDKNWDAISSEKPTSSVSGLSSSSPAMILYVSGPKGHPNGILFSHSAFLSLAAKDLGYITASPGDKVAHLAPLQSNLGIFELFFSLFHGCELVNFPYDVMKTPEQLANLLKTKEVHHVAVNSFQFDRIIADTPWCFSSVQTLLVVGAGVSLGTVATAQTHGTARQVEAVYSPAEFLGFALHLSLNDKVGERVTGSAPVGSATSNHAVYVLDRNAQPVHVGVSGELYFGGSSMASGYFARSSLEKTKFTRSPTSSGKAKAGTVRGSGYAITLLNKAPLFRSGDSAAWTSSGIVRTLGRLDTLVVFKGFRVELGEIETILTSHVGVVQAVVIPSKDAVKGPQLIAYVVPQPSQPPTFSQLKKFLKERLPRVFVPAMFVMRQSLPLDRSGAVNRADIRNLSLRPIDRGHDAEITGPRNSTEERLAGIWTQVLQIDQVGVHDNFFALGGDSLSALRIVAKSSQAGFKLTVPIIFEKPTIAELAKVAGESSVILAEQLPISGEIPVSPVQREGLNSDKSALNHWNHASVIHLDASVRMKDLSRVCHAVLVRHDVLRSRFRREKKAAPYRAFIAPPFIDPPHIQEHNLTKLKGAKQTEEMDALSTKLHKSLDLSKGPVIAFAVFETAKKTRRLLIVAHRLVIDVASWNIVLEDLNLAYQQITIDPQIDFAPKTASYRQWVEFLGGKLSKIKLDFWKYLALRNPLGVPLDFGADNPANISTKTYKISFSHEESAVLLDVVPKSYVSDLESLLLAAVWLAYQQWTSQTDFYIAHVQNDRSKLAHANLDIRRTVGWFAAICPSYYEGEAQKSSKAWRGKFGPAASDSSEDARSRNAAVRECLQAIKAQSTEFLARGIEYGILRYLSSEPKIVSTMEDIPYPEISFEWLGSLTNTNTNLGRVKCWPSTQSDHIGRTMTRSGERTHLLDFEGWISDDRLHFQASYSENVFKTSTLETFMDNVRANLKSLISSQAASSSRGGGSSSSGGGGGGGGSNRGSSRSKPVAATRYTPADFPLTAATLSQSEVETLTRKGKLIVEDIWPISPVQSDLLALQAKDPEGNVSVKHVALAFKGELDLRSLQKAADIAFERHPILRCSISTDGASEPVQLVVGGKREDVFDVKDLTASKLGAYQDQQDREVDNFLKTKTGFGFKTSSSSSSLVRTSVLIFSKDIYVVLFTYSVLVADQWSIPILIKEVFDSYVSLIGLPLKPSTTSLGQSNPTFKDFIEFERSYYKVKESKIQDKAFWSAYFRGWKGKPSMKTLEDGVDGSGSKGYDEQQIRFDIITTSKLIRLANVFQVTNSVLLQGLWSIMMSRFTGESDICYGMLFSTRPPSLGAGSEAIVGPLSNILPVRQHVSGTSYLYSWLKEVQEQHAELIARSFQTIASIQPYAGRHLPSSSTTQDLFDIVFTYGTDPGEAIDMATKDLGFGNFFFDIAYPGLDLKVSRSRFIGAGEFPMYLTAVPGPEFVLRAAYDCNRFKTSNIIRMLRDFEGLVAAIVDNPDKEIGHYLGGAGSKASSPTDGPRGSTSSGIGKGGKESISGRSGGGSSGTATRSARMKIGGGGSMRLKFFAPKQIEEKKDQKKKSRIRKQGYLTKRGAVRKSWKRRWFVLDDTHLHYFHSSSSSNPLGSIPLSDIGKMKSVNSAEFERMNVFEIPTPDRIYYIQAVDALQKEEWLGALNQMKMK